MSSRIVQKYPKVMHVLAEIVVRRLRAKERGSGASAAGLCIAVLGIDTATCTGDFTERLVRALGDIGPTLHLSGQRLDTLLNQPGIADSHRDDLAGVRLTTWLEEQEARHRFVVCEADSDASRWTLRCLRQADEILLVAHASSEPETRSHTGEYQSRPAGPSGRPTVAASRSVAVTLSGRAP